MNKNIVSGVIWVAAYTAILIMARLLPSKVNSYPTYVAVLGLLFSSLYLIINIIYSIRNKDESAKFITKKPDQTRRVLIGSALIIGLVISFNYLGFILSSMIFMFLFSHIFSSEKENNRKRILIELATSVSFTMIIYVTFNILLGIKLPTLFN